MGYWFKRVNGHVVRTRLRPETLHSGVQAQMRYLMGRVK